MFKSVRGNLLIYLFQKACFSAGDISFNSNVSRFVADTNCGPLTNGQNQTRAAERQYWRNEDESSSGERFPHGSIYFCLMAFVEESIEKRRR